MADQLRLPTRSIGLKFLLVCALALVMAIPTLAVWGVRADRQNRANAVRSEIAGAVGGQQTILGPVLLVPYSKNVKQDDKIATLRGDAVIFAERGEADSTLKMDVRKRDIFEVPVYVSTTKLRASFDAAVGLKALQALDPDARFDMKGARIVIGYSNPKGVRQEAALAVAGGDNRVMDPVAVGARPDGYSPGYAGFSMIAAPAGDIFARDGAASVEVDLVLSGAERFAIAAFAKNTAAKIKADWPDPSFEGEFLPIDRSIAQQGFAASWSAPLAARGLPSVATDTGAISQVAGKDFAVKFVEQTNVYTGVDRALKYSLMFIGLVFLTYFMFEIVSGLKAHPAQYIMVGLSQAIFYLLLLAFAERIGFNLAFLIAAGMTVALITLYVRAVFKKPQYLAPAAAAFIGLYALMFVLMRMEDYALVVGSLTSFAALALLMYLTRNVDWYGRGEAPLLRREGAPD